MCIRGQKNLPIGEKLHVTEAARMRSKANSQDPLSQTTADPRKHHYHVACYSTRHGSMGPTMGDTCTCSAAAACLQQLRCFFGCMRCSEALGSCTLQLRLESAEMDEAKQAVQKASIDMPASVLKLQVRISISIPFLGHQPRQEVLASEHLDH